MTHGWPTELLMSSSFTGYFRLGLVFAAWAVYETPALFVPLYSVSTALDGNLPPVHLI